MDGEIEAQREEPTSPRGGIIWVSFEGPASTWPLPSASSNKKVKVSIGPRTEGFRLGFQSRAHTLVAGSPALVGTSVGGNQLMCLSHINVSLSLFLSLSPSSLPSTFSKNQWKNKTKQGSLDLQLPSHRPSVPSPGAPGHHKRA
uniref:Uncharacterized protein n=1 Tax=Myotis myotis TaxID=51298 RepID=A0A7J7S1T3_MYOMY|nr:hypothetical protein mMyoMyo1_010051 [Myotis myotis]